MCSRLPHVSCRRLLVQSCMSVLALAVLRLACGILMGVLPCCAVGFLGWLGLVCVHVLSAVVDVVSLGTGEGSSWGEQHRTEWCRCPPCMHRRQALQHCCPSAVVDGSTITLDRHQLFRCCWGSLPAHIASQHDICCTCVHGYSCHRFAFLGLLALCWVCWLHGVVGSPLIRSAADLAASQLGMGR